MPGRSDQSFRVAKRQAGVLADADEAEAGGGEDPGDVGLLVDQVVVTHLGHHRFGLLGGRAGRHGHLGEQEALVLVRQEAAGQGDEQQRHAADDQAVDDEGPAPAAVGRLDAAAVAADAAVEVAVEPAGEALLVALRRPWPA